MGGSKRVIKWGIIAAIGIFLVGCDAPDPALISHKNVVYVPPASMFNCPLTPLPVEFKTNKGVAVLLAKTYGNNVVCHNNMNVIHNDLLNQKKVFGTK